MGVDENFENFSANYFIYFQEYVQRSNYTIVECMNEIEIKGGEKEIFSNMRTILLIQSLEAGGNFENFSTNYFIIYGNIINYFRGYVQRSNYTIVECMNEIGIKGEGKEIFFNMRTILLIQSLEAGGNFENFSTNYFIIYRNIINYFPKYVQRSNYMIVECINEIEIKRIALRMSSGMISKMLKRKERGGKFFSDTRAP